MFEDGLHNTVNIYGVVRNTGQITDKTDTSTAEAPSFENVACRIIRDEKVMFAGDFLLEDGCRLCDIDSGESYQIRGVMRRIKGLSNKAHHTTYDIEKRSRDNPAVRRTNIWTALK